MMLRRNPVFIMARRAFAPHIGRWTALGANGNDRGGAGEGADKPLTIH
jgi:hypothetical protein